jgi:hypothetical protein
MLQIVYISTARRVLEAEELALLLDGSRRRNAAVGVSGLLVAGGRRFIQALEGPEEEVLATFARIKADPRHFAVVELSHRTVAERQFGEWSMRFEQGRQDLRARVEEVVSRLADKTLRAHFTGFAELHAAG